MNDSLTSTKKVKKQELKNTKESDTKKNDKNNFRKNENIQNSDNFQTNAKQILKNHDNDDIKINGSSNQNKTINKKKSGWEPIDFDENDPTEFEQLHNFDVNEKLIQDFQEINLNEEEEDGYNPFQEVLVSDIVSSDNPDSPTPKENNYEKNVDTILNILNQNNLMSDGSVQEEGENIKGQVQIIESSYYSEEEDIGFDFHIDDKSTADNRSVRSTLNQDVSKSESPTNDKIITNDPKIIKDLSEDANSLNNVNMKKIEGEEFSNHNDEKTLTEDQISISGEESDIPVSETNLPLNLDENKNLENEKESIATLENPNFFKSKNSEVVQNQCGVIQNSEENKPYTNQNEQGISNKQKIKIPLNENHKESEVLSNNNKEDHELNFDIDQKKLNKSKKKSQLNSPQKRNQIHIDLSKYIPDIVNEESTPNNLKKINIEPPNNDSNEDNFLNLNYPEDEKNQDEANLELLLTPHKTHLINPRRSINKNSSKSSSLKLSSIHPLEERLSEYLNWSIRKLVSDFAVDLSALLSQINSEIIIQNFINDLRQSIRKLINFSYIGSASFDNSDFIFSPININREVYEFRNLIHQVETMTPEYYKKKTSLVNECRSQIQSCKDFINIGLKSILNDIKTESVHATPKKNLKKGDKLQHPINSAEIYDQLYNLEEKEFNTKLEFDILELKRKFQESTFEDDSNDIPISEIKDAISHFLKYYNKKNSKSSNSFQFNDPHFYRKYLNDIDEVKMELKDLRKKHLIQAQQYCSATSMYMNILQNNLRNNIQNASMTKTQIETNLQADDLVNSLRLQVEELNKKAEENIHDTTLFIEKIKKNKNRPSQSNSRLWLSSKTKHKKKKHYKHNRNHRVNQDNVSK